MREYTTRSGDMWDGIAFRELGSVNLVSQVIKANRDKVNYLVFPAGVKLIIPDVDNQIKLATPPWRK